MKVPKGQLPDLAAPSGGCVSRSSSPCGIVVDPVDDREAAPPLGRSGAQANVVVLAEKGSIFNPVARLWMRVITC
jgi:hypothetical protein